MNVYEQMNKDSKVVITQERFAELIRKEFVFDMRKAELEKNTYVIESDKYLYGIKEKVEEPEEESEKF